MAFSMRETQKFTVISFLDAVKGIWMKRGGHLPEEPDKYRCIQSGNHMDYGQAQQDQISARLTEQFRSRCGMRYLLSGSCLHGVDHVA